MTDGDIAPTAPAAPGAPPLCRCLNEYCHHHAADGCTLDAMFVLHRVSDGMPDAYCGWCAYVGMRRGELQS